MEIIHLDGYTEHEKVKIAQEHLVKRQLEANGLREGEVVFSEEALRKIVQDYTREAGVRNLERQIGAICRKSVAKIAERDTTQAAAAVEITPEVVRELLRKEKFESESSESIEIPGVATGLAVTPVGGDILFIEATRMKGKGEFTLTGQLGDVMRESARIALSYVRSKAVEIGVDPDAFAQTDVHVHVPAGATPKDGPSAGVAMTMAIASLLHRSSRQGRRGNDRRGDASRARASHRRGQDEGPGRAPRGPFHRHPPQAQRTRPGRASRGREKQDDLRPGGPHR